MKVRLLDFHCVINYNDMLLGCGMYAVNYERAILFEGKSSADTVYLALIIPEVQEDENTT
jgi:hypothetical protein